MPFTAIGVPICAIATLLVLLRVFARGKITKTLGSDDWLVAVAMLFSWVFCALNISNISNGLGADLSGLQPAEVDVFLKIDLTAQVMYLLSTLFLHLSLLVFYMRLSGGRPLVSNFRRIAFAIGIFNFVYISMSCIIIIFGCTPVSGSWDMTINRQCINKQAYYYAVAVFNIMNDWGNLVLGLRLCGGLKVTTERQWELGDWFLIASLASVVSIIRLVTMAPTLHSGNFTSWKVQFALWCLAEVNTGIICGCIPCLIPIFHRRSVLSPNLPALTNVDANANQQFRHTTKSSINSAGNAHRSSSNRTHRKTTPKNSTSVDEYHAYRFGDKNSDVERNEEVAVLEQYHIPPIISAAGEVEGESDGESIALRPVVWEESNVA